MISEEQQEQSALYALGLLDADEAAAFERALAADAELREAAEELREVALSLALAAGPDELVPSAGLKARLLTEVGREIPVALASPAKGTRSPWTTWVPWAVATAAVVAAFVSILDRNYLIKERDRMYDSWQNANFLRAQEATTRPESTPLVHLAVCQLEPTPDAPVQPRAAVVWDPSHRQGKLVITRLKAPADGHDYQLWAVEEGHKDTVSAGVVHVDGEGNVRVEFKPTDADGAKVQAFALSLEQAGGSAKNQGPILLLGKF